MPKKKTEVIRLHEDNGRNNRFIDCVCKLCKGEFKMRVKDIHKTECPHCHKYGFVLVTRIDRP